MLSKKAKYALKAMLRLAASPDALVQAGDIAEQESIPKKFLDLIFFELRNEGFIEARRGKGGGYTLALAPKDITIGEIIRAVDGPLAPIACASINFYERCADCKDERSCAIRKMMKQVRDATSEILDNITLADALGKPRLKQFTG
ncbi:MAG: Rrf2 family transcriptional regulator [Caulobacterales bacterium]